jgi:hypothetical protein
MAIKWFKISEARYVGQLEMLPPARWSGVGFLSGEPYDHTRDGRPRFKAFAQLNGEHFEAADPLTHGEFCSTMPRDVLANVVAVPATTGPEYPAIRVQLVEREGNAFAILGRVIDGMRRGGVPADQVDAFRREATGGNYDNLLRTCRAWVTCNVVLLALTIASTIAAQADEMADCLNDPVIALVAASDSALSYADRTNGSRGHWSQ